MMEITQKNIYLLFAASLMAVSLMAGFVVYPVFSDVRDISKSILSDKGREIFVERQNRELEGFKADYGEYKSELDRLSGFFADAQNPISFIEFLETSAQNANIDVSLNLPAPAKKEAGFRAESMALQIFAKGDFADMMAFARSLERGPYFIQINRVVMDGVLQENPDTPVSPDAVRATITLEVLAK